MINTYMTIKFKDLAPTLDDFSSMVDSNNFMGWNSASLDMNKKQIYELIYGVLRTDYSNKYIAYDTPEDFAVELGFRLANNIDKIKRQIELINFLHDKNDEDLLSSSSTSENSNKGVSGTIDKNFSNTSEDLGETPNDKLNVTDDNAENNVNMTVDSSGTNEYIHLDNKAESSDSFKNSGTVKTKSNDPYINKMYQVKKIADLGYGDIANLFSDMFISVNDDDCVLYIEDF